MGELGVRITSAHNALCPACNEVQRRTALNPNLIAKLHVLAWSFLISPHLFLLFLELI